MVTFVISEAEYIEACQLFARRPLRKAALPVVLLIGAFAVFAPSLGLNWPGAIAGIVGGLIGGVLASLVSRRVWLPRKARTLFRQHQALRDPFALRWDEAGVAYTSSLGQGQTPWSHYREAREGDSVFILLVTDSMYHIVPKSALGTETEIAAFREAASRVRV